MEKTLVDSRGRKSAVDGDGRICKQDIFQGRQCSIVPCSRRKPRGVVGSPLRIEETILSGKISRADGIMEEARAGKFATVVVGRKGLADVPEFLMDRIARKVLSLCGDRAVWIV